jgi:hypothetical protein
MGKKRLIWASLWVLLLGIPALVHARVGFPLHGHSKHENVSQSTGQQSTSYRMGYDQGYPRGFDQGKSDHSVGSNYDFDDNQDYKDPDDIGWTSAMGNTAEFRDGFRAGFKLGYQDGYSGKEPQLAVAPALPEVEQPLAAEVTPSQAPAELARAEEPGEVSPYRTGWDTGYKTGYEGGQADHSSGAKLDMDDAPGYKGGHAFCEPIEGKGEHRCRKGYREGFKQGYQDGYSGLVSRLITPQAPAQSQAAAPAMEAPSQPETPSQPEQPSTAMQETPQQPEAQSQPRALPKTASGLPLIGLIGLAVIALSLLSRTLRRIARNNAA